MLKYSLRPKSLEISYLVNYFSLPKVRKMIKILDQSKVRKIIILDLPKDSEPIIIFGLLKASKMTSLRIFVSPVMVGTTNIKLEQLVYLLKVFHRTLYRRCRYGIT